MILKKPAPDFDPGWQPVFGQDHAPKIMRQWEIALLFRKPPLGYEM